MNRLDPKNTIFQEDNAAIYIYKFKKYWLKKKILMFWNGPLILRI